MAQQNINTGTLPNDKTGDSLRTAMIKVQNNFTELYATAPISNSVNIGNTTSNVVANSTAVFIGNSGTYSIANSSSITTTTGYYSQVLNSGANNLVIGTTNATSILVYTNGITSANQRVIVAANGNVGVGNAAPAQLLTVGGTMSANQVIIGNTTVNFTINATFIPATANYALLANGTNYVGSVTAANVVSNAQLQANLANYTNTAGLTSYVAGATANNTAFVGSVTAANVVSNAQLSANLANYQTTAGFTANVAAYLPTYTGVVNGATFSVGTSTIANSSGVYATVVNAASHTVGSGFVANATGVTTNNLTVSTNTATIGSVFYSVANGNIGIGTSSPSYKVQLGGSGALNFANSVWLRLDSSGGGTANDNWIGRGGIGGNSVAIYANSTSGIELGIANQLKFNIVANGNIGVGTGSPDTQFAVLGSANVSGQITVAGVTVVNSSGISLGSNTAGFKPPTTNTIYSSSGTYTTPTGVKWLRVRMVGGGGGGGGAASGPGGGGGGAAGYCESIIASPSSTYSYSIGSGGTAGTAGGGSGGTGGATTFGSMTAYGGGGGEGAPNNIVPAGGPGGNATGGTTINSSGMPGGWGYGATFSSNLQPGGNGGSSLLGGGATPDNPGDGQTGTNASGFGGGGSGAGGSNGAHAGGSGYSGVIIIEEYYNY